MISNEPRYWFPAKRYGWGWGPPAVWQGWGFLCAWLAAFFSGVTYLIPRHGFLHVAFASTMVIVLLLVCYWKGEPPKWRWGK
jgi:hypothetical protein